MEYRVEEKYVCTEGELLILTGRLSPLMQEDAHHGEDTKFAVCILMTMRIHVLLRLWTE